MAGHCIFSENGFYTMWRLLCAVSLRPATRNGRNLRFGQQKAPGGLQAAAGRL
jgi:hypothetical protein